MFGIVEKVLDGAVLPPKDNLLAGRASEQWSGTFATPSKFTRACSLAALLPTGPRSLAIQTGTVSKPWDRAGSLPKMGSVALRAREQGEDVTGHPPLHGSG